MVKGGCTCDKWERVMHSPDSPIFYADGLGWYIDYGQSVEEPIFICPFCPRRLTPPEEVGDESI